MAVSMKRALYASSALLSAMFVAQSARAQTAPTSSPALRPTVMSTVDGVGVDAVSGQLLMNDMTISVGNPGEGGLSWSYTHTGDPLVPTVDLSQGWQTDTSASVARVNLGTTASIFKKGTTNGVPDPGWVLVSGPAGTLTQDANGNYLYTALDGTVVSINSINMANWIKYPSGEIRTFTWTIVDPNVGSSSGYHISAVSNNLGYMIKYQYIAGTSTLASITAVNLAQDYCDPAAASCSFANHWMSLTFSGVENSTQGLTITDNLGRTENISWSGTTETIKRPGLAAITVKHNATGSGPDSGKVSEVDTAAGNWTYTYSTQSNGGGVGVVDVVGTDPTGRSVLTVVSYPQEQVATIVRPQNGGTQYDRSRVTYDYQNGQNGGPNDGQISTVSTQYGPSTTYHYIGAGGPADTVTRTASDGTSSIVTATAGYAYSGGIANCPDPALCDKPTYVTDAVGNRTDFTYNGSSSSGLPGGVHTELAPPPNAGAAIGPGNWRQLTTYGYTQFHAVYKDSSGNLVQDPNPVWRLTSVTICDADGNGACQDPSSHQQVTTLQYATADTGADKLPLQLTNKTVKAADGSVALTTNYTYNVYGDVRTQSDPASGQTTRNRYDYLRRLVGQVGLAPGNDTSGNSQPTLATRYNYPADAASPDPQDDNGQPTSVDSGTVVDQSDNSWINFTVKGTVATAYDSMGRAIRQDRKDPSGGIISVQQTDYDGAGRVTYKAVRMNPSVYSQLPSLAQTPSTPGSFGPDRITAYSYDDIGRVSSVTSGYQSNCSAAADCSVLQTNYTDTGKIRSLTDPNGNTTNYTYDGYDRLSTVQYPDGGTDYESYTYFDTDAVHTYRRRDGETTTYAVDAAGRIIGETGAVSATFGYDNFGHLTSATRDGFTVANSYDALGELLSSTQPAGAVSYTYQGGLRHQLIWPDGSTITYHYDGADALDAIYEGASATGTPLVGFAYDYQNGLGQRTSITRANQVKTTYGYDPSTLLLSSLDHTLPSDPSKSVAFTFNYNPAGQLIGRGIDNSAYIFAPQAASQSYGVNNLNQLTNSALTYNDGRGNLTSDAKGAYSYDPDNRMATVTPTGQGSATQINYDPLDRLYQVQQGGVVTRELYDGADLIAEYDGSGKLLRRYVHGSGQDEPLVWYEFDDTTQSPKQWLLSDPLGSIIGLTNTGGYSSGVNTYDEYGQQGASNKGRFRYTGQTYYDESGLYYYKARFYSQYLGRFMQPDPIGYDDGPNMYAYVHGDPVNFTDPSGLVCGNGMSPNVPNPTDGTVDTITVTGSCADYLRMWDDQGVFWFDNMHFQAEGFAGMLSDYGGPAQYGGPPQNTIAGVTITAHKNCFRSALFDNAGALAFDGIGFVASVVGTAVPAYGLAAGGVGLLAATGSLINGGAHGDVTGVVVGAVGYHVGAYGLATDSFVAAAKSPVSRIAAKSIPFVGVVASTVALGVDVHEVSDDYNKCRSASR